MATKRKPKINPIAAQQRASDLFNVGTEGFSLFPPGRVTGAALKSAMRGMIERTLAIVPHVAPKGCNVRLTFIGSGAFCKSEVTWNTKLRAQAVINLPSVADRELLSRTVANSWTAYALHELGHVLFTPSYGFRYGIERMARECSMSGINDACSWINAFEDVVIERNLISLQYARGFGSLAKSLCAHHVAQSIQDKGASLLVSVKAGDVKAFPFVVAFAGRRYGIMAADSLRDALPTRQRRVYDGVLERLDAIPPRTTEQTITDGLSAVVDAAIWAYQQLHDKSDGQPSDGDGQPSDGDGQPSDGDGQPSDGDGQPSDGDGQPSDGDGQPSDGDGQPSDGLTDYPSTELTPIDDRELSEADTSYSDTVLDSCIVTGDTSDAINADIAKRDALRFARTSARLQLELRRLFTHTDTESCESGKKSGRLRIAALPRVQISETVFERRERLDGINTAVCLLLDGSSSMAGQYIDATKNMALMLGHLLSQCVGVRFEVAIFDSHGVRRNTDFGQMLRSGNSDIAPMAPCAYRIIKAYAEPVSKLYARMPAQLAQGGTPDYEALVLAGRRLLAQDAGRRVLFVLTDGEGSRVKQFADHVKQLERDGVICVGLGLGYRMTEKFKHQITVTNPSDLNGSAMLAILRAVAPRTDERT